MSSEISGNRIAIENILAALGYWCLSHLNFLVFKEVGVLPMPIWPAAALAIVAAFYRGWSIAPGIAAGTVLANHFTLGGVWYFAACIAIMNTVGPIIGAGLARRRVGRIITLNSLSDALVFVLATIILTPALTASGGIGFKWLFGLMPGAAVPAGLLKWFMAHALGSLFFAMPVFAWCKGRAVQ